MPSPRTMGIGSRVTVTSGVLQDDRRDGIHDDPKCCAAFEGFTAFLSGAVYISQRSSRSDYTIRHAMPSSLLAWYTHLGYTMGTLDGRGTCGYYYGAESRDQN